MAAAPNAEDIYHEAVCNTAGNLIEHMATKLQESSASVFKRRIGDEQMAVILASALVNWTQSRGLDPRRIADGIYAAVDTEEGKV
jgi:hypothetical protein